MVRVRTKSLSMTFPRTDDRTALKTMYEAYKKDMTAPSGETPWSGKSISDRVDWMYAASETSPAAHPKEMGRKQSAVYQALQDRRKRQQARSMNLWTGTSTPNRSANGRRIPVTFDVKTGTKNRRSIQICMVSPIFGRRLDQLGQKRPAFARIRTHDLQGWQKLHSPVDIALSDS